jgi:hypothetical protein
MECNCLPKLESTCLCLPIQERCANCSHLNYTTKSIKVLGTAVFLLSVITGYLLIHTHQLSISLQRLQIGDGTQRLQIGDRTQTYLAQEDRFQSENTIYLQKKSAGIHVSEIFPISNYCYFYLIEICSASCCFD